MAGLTTLDGNLSEGASSVELTANITTPTGTYLLVDSEVIKQGALSSGTTYACTRAEYGTTDILHDSGAQVYEVTKVQNQAGGLWVYYIDGATTKLLVLTTAAGQVVLGFTAPTPLTDSSGGTPGSTLPAGTTNFTDSTTGTPATTLTAIDTSTLATAAGECDNNFASLNHQINLLNGDYKTAVASLNHQINLLSAAVAAMTASIG